MLRFFAACAVVVASGVVVSADEPCKSGPQPAQRPGPYSSLIVVGPERGQPHCFVCDAGDRPIVMIFARSLGEPLGKLASRVDQALAAHKVAELRGWVTVLAEGQKGLDANVVQWSQKHALKNLPVGIFEDPVGPPTYLIARDADVTVILSTKQRVVANFAFRAGELNDTAIDAIVRAVPRIVVVKK